MKLARFQISNHARLADCDMTVRQHLVLVGPNDVGKSSLLRCLDLALGASAAALYARITPDDFRDQSQPFVVECTMSALSDDEKALFPDEVSFDPATSEITLLVRLEATLDDSGALVIRRTAPSGSTGRQIDRAQFEALGWRMVGAAHGGVRDFKDERNSSLDDILRTIDLGADGLDLERLAQEFQDKLGTAAVLDDLRERLSGQLSKAVPTPVAKDDLRFVTGALASDDLLSDVRLQVHRNGKAHSMAEQSDGARALFAIALYDLVSESANIVAIDEPEIHLHPTSQRSLARLLRAGSNQKVLTTHSPDIVGRFDPEDVIAVRPGGQLVQPEEGFLSHHERLVAHWWVRDRLEPLTAGHVLLVEGVADRILVQKCAELLGHDLDRLGVAVLELDGAGDVKSVLTLFGRTGFNIDLSLLIDLDAVSNTEAALGITAADFEAHRVYVCDRDLESEYVAAMRSGPAFEAIESAGLFSANELALCVPTGDGGVLTTEDVAKFCRRAKRGGKVRAAIAVADGLTAKQAKRMKPVARLLQAIADA